MAKLTFPIQPDGLICNVMIGLDGKAATALVAAGQPVLAPILCRGLIDTGSDITCVAPAVLRRLGLSVPVAKSKTSTTTGSAPVDLFETSVNVLDLRNVSGPKLILPVVVVMEIPSPFPNLDVMIGLDVLLTARLFLDGPRR
ncbi:MAG: hypothetical protein ACRELF_16140, partial [Gemmataceae bacterium]